jgi:hypothetical protein
MECVIQYSVPCVEQNAESCLDSWTEHLGISLSNDQQMLIPAYKAPTNPWRWQPFAETCRGRIWNVLIKKIHYFLEHLWVVSQRKCWAFKRSSGKPHSALKVRYLYSLYHRRFFRWLDRPSGPRPHWDFTITRIHAIVSRTALDEGSALLRDLYLTTHNNHKR